MAVHEFQARRHGQQPFAIRLLQHRISQWLRPGLQRQRRAQCFPVGKRLGLGRQQLVHGFGAQKAKRLVEHHAHHLGAGRHHLNQKRQFLAALGQVLFQHMLAVGVKAQVMQLGLIGFTQVGEKRGGVHKGNSLRLYQRAASTKGSKYPFQIDCAVSSGLSSKLRLRLASYAERRSASAKTS